MVKALKISGKSCELEIGYGVLVGGKDFSDILSERLGENFKGTVDIEINIKEIDTSLKIESNVEPVEEEEMEE